MVELALALGASRVEIAHVQYYGWALKNRAALMPTREQVDARGRRRSRTLRAAHHGRIVIDAVVPDYYARYPEALHGRLGAALAQRHAGRQGAALPRRRSRSRAWNSGTVRDHSLADIWRNSPAFNAFRGTDWMREPCASCPRREQDFGGCRCQAFLLTGDAAATDPVCHLSPAA